MCVFVSECMYESGCVLLSWAGMCVVWGIGHVGGHFQGTHECEGHREACSPRGLG